MKHQPNKKLLTVALLGIGAIFLSGCTASFCSDTDQSSMAYPYDQGATVYLSKAHYEYLKTNGDEKTKNVIAQEEKWSADAAALGLPAIAGQAIEGNDSIYKYIPFTYSNEGTFDVNTQTLVFDKFAAAKAGSVLNETIASARTNGYYVPSVYYFGLIDDLTLKAAIIESDEVNAGWGKYVMNSDGSDNWASYAASTGGKEFIANLTVSDTTNNKWAVSAYVEGDNSATDDTKTAVDYTRSVLRRNGSIKYSGNLYADKNGDEARDLWTNLDAWNAKIATYRKAGFSELESYALPSADFMTAYKSNITSKVAQIRSCITTRDGFYGHYGADADWRVSLKAKDWGYAWHKGLLEGLLVYPVSWLTETFAVGMDPAMTGVGQIWSIIFVTLIVRGLLMLVSFRSTMDSQKMQALQPELAKIQAKYPNSNTNQAEKQRLSQEQMALYKRHNIKPFRQFLVLLIQFPLFICVWSGLQGSAVLATGEFLNLSLSDTIQQTLFNVSGAWYANAHGWWTALVLFLLMAGTQILAMMLPRWMQKKATKNIAKMGVNNAQDEQGKTMKTVSIFMMVFTIIMGFMLPSAMGVYWAIGGVMSILQTVITQAILAKSKKGKKK